MYENFRYFSLEMQLFSSTENERLVSLVYIRRLDKYLRNNCHLSLHSDRSLVTVETATFW